MDVKKALRSEIERVARRQIRQENEALRKAATRHRSDIAELKRQHKQLQRQIDRLDKDLARARSQAPKAGEAPSQPTRRIRFSADWLRKHREKLGLSANDYGSLVGVHPITIYNWEQGKSKPRLAQLEKLAEVRGIGKREAVRRLEASS
ncbi:MAG: helix-turn-helix domain-containing protein [Pseudomonadota bacterium]